MLYATVSYCWEWIIINITVGVCLCQMSISFIVLFLSREKTKISRRWLRAWPDLSMISGYTYNSHIYMQSFIDADATYAWRSERAEVFYVTVATGERACEKERDGRKRKTDRDAGYWFRSTARHTLTFLCTLRGSRAISRVLPPAMTWGRRLSVARLRSSSGPFRPSRARADGMPTRVVIG